LERKAEALGIADKVIWYGLVSGEEKWNMLASSDLFLFLSRSEGLPMTILEALAC
jgi:glycosyltransferase involved in cell wall biosynthesis